MLEEIMNIFCRKKTESISSVSDHLCSLYASSSTKHSTQILGKPDKQDKYCFYSIISCQSSACDCMFLLFDMTYSAGHRFGNI